MRTSSRLPVNYLEMIRKEFVVDEPPEAVVMESKERSRGKRLGTDAPQIAEKEKDLLCEISSMLMEQERLERLAEELSKKDAETRSEGFFPLFRAALPVLDSFDRIIQMAQDHPPSEELQNWLKGVATLQGRLLALFEAYGLRVMDPIGKRVNLDRHEVVEVIHNESIPDETIVQVRQKGYIYNGKIIRDARVVVAQNERG
jgi:molecular chaperone GrpE